MVSKLSKILDNHPVVPAIKNKAGLEAVLKTDCEIVFILYGDILNIIDIAGKITDSGKMAIVNEAEDHFSVKLSDE